jgi:hypothetical protein
MIRSSPLKPSIEPKESNPRLRVLLQVRSMNWKVLPPNSAALQEFLKSETDRMQREVESALAGLRIIIETISPWKSIPASVATPRREGLNGKGVKRLSDGTN